MLKRLLMRITSFQSAVIGDDTTLAVSLSGYPCGIFQILNDCMCPGGTGSSTPLSTGKRLNPSVLALLIPGRNTSLYQYAPSHRLCPSSKFHRNILGDRICGIPLSTLKMTGGVYDKQWPLILLPSICKSNVGEAWTMGTSAPLYFLYNPITDVFELFSFHIFYPSFFWFFPFTGL